MFVQLPIWSIIEWQRVADTARKNITKFARVSWHSPGSAGLVINWWAEGLSKHAI
jgi:hypothetical protein